jgi:hypothetical protein
MAKRSMWSWREQLLLKSREAALTAIKVFNDPLVNFKSETYIVLMIIAWTYLLHAYYRKKRVEYRYFTQGPKRKKFDRTKHGAFKYWELERCLNEAGCPVDADAANNLRFLVGLRNEIEHQMTKRLDAYLSGRYQACAVNYNDAIKAMFGARYGIDSQLAYSIQFLELTEQQIEAQASESGVPAKVRAYIREFDGKLTADQYNSPRYSYRFFFVPKLANHPGQADKVVEFIKADSELAQSIQKEYWVKKEVERPKFLAKHVVQKVQQAGFPKFRVQPDHVQMWKAEDAKNPGKGYGTNVEGSWFWYESWVKRCIQLCEAAGDKYKTAG